MIAMIGISPFHMVLVFALAAALVWLTIRRGWIYLGQRFGPAAAFLPASVPPASGAARIVEATVLGTAGVIILAIAATSPRSGGYLLVLDQLRPDYAIANAVMFGCAAACAIVAVLIALWGRTPTGAIVLAVVLTAYSYVLHGGQYPGRWLLPKQMAVPIVDYAINLSGCNVEGAELWVNGVSLGKTPYTTTLDEFEAKVPYWPKPPVDYETNKVDTVHYQPNGTSGESRRRWIKFEAPVRFPPPDWPARGMQWREEVKTYYAKVRYAGEWGLAGGGSRWAGSGLGPTRYLASSDVTVIFPERQGRLDALLNIARAGNYRVGPDWFQAIATYNEDGWIALRQAAENEPRMMEVIDAWAVRRYGLDKATDADSAWQIFQKICDEAGAQRQYFTPSIAGRAVELLTPKLPQSRLIDRTVELIRNAETSSYLNWDSNGHLSCGYSERPGGAYLGSTCSALINLAGDAVGARRFAVREYPVMHALWLLNDRLRSSGQPQPNVVQQHIVSEIVRAHYKDFDTLPMMLASYIGGPDVDKFLLRQSWGTAPDLRSQADWTYVSAQQVNKWLYLLAYLNDDAGHKFRQTHAGLFMELADRAYQWNVIAWHRDLVFVFMDPWLAMEYWPHFARLARQKALGDSLKTQWEYLSSMGAAATVDMFVEAWKETDLKNGDLPFALGVLDRLKSPMQQHQVIDALVRQVREHPQNLAGLAWKPDGPPESVVSMLRAHDQQAEWDRIFAELQKGPQKGLGSCAGSLWHDVPLWLAHTQPDSPLVAMLAKADKPELRLLVMGALREYPTPQNQALLEKLRKDADPAVRAAAETISQQLKNLAAQKPAAFASDAMATANTSATSPPAGKKGREGTLISADPR